jgi:putative hydrolase of HD superfamily
MDISALRERLLELLALKALPRAGWVRVGVPVPESVAAHSWGVAFLALLLCPDSLDRGRVLGLALVHDLAEVEVGDITPHDGIPTHEKHRREAEAMSRLVQPLPRGAEVEALYREYAAKTSPEACFVRACDKLDLALQSARYAADGAVTRELWVSALAGLDDPTLRALAGQPPAG